MSLIIPTGVSTYADASSTRTGGPLRTYVLAQFRSDANLEWVRELRGILVKDELKHQDFAAARDKFKNDQSLWSRIEVGVGQASIIAIDPKPIDSSVREFFAAQNRVGDDAPTEKEFFDSCATALIAGTPVAFFPDRITMSVPWAFRQELGTLYDFSPASIQERLGGGLRNAKIFAARAHALCDLRSSDASTTREAISDLSSVAMSELLSTIRNFDVENKPTVDVLNDAAAAIAESIEQRMPLIGRGMPKPLVREVDSRAIDEVQAADIAAGWAAEILDSGEPRQLGARFERVWLNGRQVK
jgi:hypothetical protein